MSNLKAPDGGDMALYNSMMPWHIRTQYCYTMGDYRAIVRRDTP